MLLYTSTPRTHFALGITLGLLTGLPTTTAAAQSPAPSAPLTFVYLRGTDTLGVEQVSASPAWVRGILVAKGQPRIEWEQTRTGGTVGPLSMRVFAAGAGADATPQQVVAFAASGDSVAVQLGTGTMGRTQRMASRPGAIVLIGNSVLHSALVARQVQQTKQSTVPVFLTNGGQTVDASVQGTGDSTVLTLVGMAMRIRWGGDAMPVEIAIPSQQLRVVRATGAAMPAPAPPVNYDAPADAPYTAEHVTIPTPRGYTLAGTFTRPRGPAKVPVVITVSGSGLQDRDSRIALVPGYAPFREIADTLGRRGIGVLRFDDRGAGQSGGRESAARATSRDLADDVVSILAWLRTRPDVDTTRLAVAGHSEGGLIGPMVGVREPSLRALVLLAGPAYTGRRILEFQNENGIRSAPGLSEAQRDSLRRLVPAALDSLAQANPWVAYFMTYDPLATARLLAQPVLVLQGDTDQQVTPEQADSLAAAIRAGGHAPVTVRHFPATNHLFLPDPSGDPRGYGALPERRVNRDMLGTLVDWLIASLR